MTGVGERTDRPPVRARSGRRPLPPIIFLVVLAVAALVVWWNVFRTDASQEARQEAACSSASRAAPSIMRVLFRGPENQGVSTCQP